MKNLILLSSILFLIACNSSETNSNSTNRELIPEHDKNLNPTSTCSATSTDFLNLKDKAFQADFFAQLDSVLNVQYPNNEDREPEIFVDLNPQLLTQFLNDINEDTLRLNNNFEKEYHFNISPPENSDPKKCMDKISITFYKDDCSFGIGIFNTFFADWCQESMVRYGFEIKDGKIVGFGRQAAG